MHLIALKANKSSFKPLVFNASGTSIILAKKSTPDLSDNARTYNGVGKSLIIVIIHFCLGSKSNSELAKKLYEWTFTLHFRIGTKQFTATRRCAAQDTIILNDEELPLHDFNKRLQDLCFDIPENVKFLSFRSLIPFFIRPNRSAYLAFDRMDKHLPDFQVQLYNAFLLGLNVDLALTKWELRKKQEELKKFTAKVRNDPTLHEFFIPSHDSELVMKDLEDRIAILTRDLEKFEVAADYYELAKEADALKSKLLELQNERILLQNRIAEVDAALRIKPDLSAERISRFYREAKFTFSTQVTKTLQEVTEFYTKLKETRLKRYADHKQQLLSQSEVVSQELLRVQSALDSKLKNLGRKQAFDVYISINNELQQLQRQRESLQSYQDLIDSYEKKKTEIRKNLIQQDQQTHEYLETLEPNIEKVRVFFRNLAKTFYPSSPAGITIHNNEGENQIRYIIDAKIESDASDGIGHVKVFCYDLTIALAGFGHRVGFLFHDNRIFHGVDERKIAQMIREATKYFPSGGSHQYIFSINENQLEEIRPLFTDEEYRKVISDRIILTLHDADDSGKLLGTKLDLNLDR